MGDSFFRVSVVTRDFGGSVAERFVWQLRMWWARHILYIRTLSADAEGNTTI